MSRFFPGQARFLRCDLAPHALTARTYPSTSSPLPATHRARRITTAGHLYLPLHWAHARTALRTPRFLRRATFPTFMVPRSTPAPTAVLYRCQSLAASGRTFGRTIASTIERTVVAATTTTFSLTLPGQAGCARGRWLGVSRQHGAGHAHVTHGARTAAPRTRHAPGMFCSISSFRRRKIPWNVGRRAVVH